MISVHQLNFDNFGCLSFWTKTGVFWKKTDQNNMHCYKGNPSTVPSIFVFESPKMG